MSDDSPNNNSRQGFSRMKFWNGVAVAAVLLIAAATGHWLDNRPQEVPPAWRTLVKTKGQAYPVPASWISTEEGRIAHDLVLPAGVPGPVPFDFDKADGPWFWHASKRDLGLAYFKHLCSTEAGEWIFEKPENVEGLYFARPEGEVTDRYLGDVYGPEAPWIEKEFQLMGDGVDWRGGQFVRPPFRRYLYVEEPWRDVKWQENVRTPFIRISGYTSAYERDAAGIVRNVVELTPMKMVGVDHLESKYGYTWRGISRPRDRDLLIAGGELIIYELVSKRVIAVSRNFQFTRPNPRNDHSATWLISPGCQKGIWPGQALFMSEFASRVLKQPSE